MRGYQSNILCVGDVSEFKRMNADLTMTGRVAMGSPPGSMLSNLLMGFDDRDYKVIATKLQL